MIFPAGYSVISALAPNFSIDQLVGNAGMGSLARSRECGKAAAVSVPPEPPRPHCRATHAHGVIGQKPGPLNAKLGERGASKGALFPGIVLLFRFSPPIFFNVKLRWLRIYFCMRFDCHPSALEPWTRDVTRACVRSVGTWVGNIRVLLYCCTSVVLLYMVGGWVVRWMAPLYCCCTVLLYCC